MVKNCTVPQKPDKKVEDFFMQKYTYELKKEIIFDY
ncbi:hypothetical protein BCF89_1233, partial [Metamycoplasma auris]